MTNAERIRQAFDEDIHIEVMYDLGSLWVTCHDRMRVPEQIEEFIQDNWRQEDAHVSVEPFMKQFWENEDDTPELEILQGMPPTEAAFLLVKFATPLRTYHSAQHFSSSQGACQTIWVMAETLEEAWKLGTQWARSVHNVEMINAGFRDKLEPPKDDQVLH